MYLERPFHISHLEPEDNESQHAEPVEEAGGNHEHVQQSADVFQQGEDNSQHPSEQKPGHRGQCVLVDI